MLTNPVYPTFAEAIRFLANALDLRSGTHQTTQDRMDRAAKNGDFKTEIFDELLETVLVAPLRALPDPDFADVVGGVMRQWRDEHARMVRRVPADALHREDLMPLLVRYWYAPWTAAFLRDLEDYGLIRAALLMAGGGHALPGAPHPTPLEVVISAFLWDHRREPTAHPGHAFYPTEHGDRNRSAETVTRWISGTHLPDLASINELVRAARQQSWFTNPRPDLALADFRRELLVARALQYASELAPGRDFMALVRAELDVPRKYDVGSIISDVVVAHGNSIGLGEIGLQTLHAFDFSVSKSAAELAAGATLMQQFEEGARSADAAFAVDWMVAWCRGRRAAWEGQYNTSLEFYEAAFAGAAYRSGKTGRAVLAEALLLAYLLGKRAAVKRLVRQGMAIRMMPAIFEFVSWDTKGMREIANMLIRNYAPCFPCPTESSNCSGQLHLDEDSHDLSARSRPH